MSLNVDAAISLSLLYSPLYTSCPTSRTALVKHLNSGFTFSCAPASPDTTWISLPAFAASGRPKTGAAR